MSFNKMADKMEEMETRESEESVQFLNQYENVNQFVQETLKSVLMATKCSNEMPAEGDDFDFFSSYEGFTDIMNVEGGRILHMIQSILKHQNVKVNLGASGGVTDIEDKLDMMMDANDQILERVGAWLDEASGIKKTDTSLVVATATPKQNMSSWNKKSPGSSGAGTSPFRLLTARNITRPQLKFKDKVDNGRRPFRPIIRTKPHAKKSLEESLQLPEGTSPDMEEKQDFRYPHPYQYELDTLSYPAGQLEACSPQEPASLEETPLTIVDTPEGLEALVSNLRKQTEIAVDLEHHNYRTFQGITCLMQVSTRSHDYLIDTLELRSELYQLNDIFADPAIVKVFHGADSDIDWLQRDLGLYVVNLFDTGQASRVMNFSRFSLAHLLQQYCQVTADKQYQLADWRIRPLPAELLKYAREDTHYLLYIYDRMKNELLERGNESKNLLHSVLQRSVDVCAKVYKKPEFHPLDYMELYRKNKKVFNSQQVAALQQLYAWRDETARLEDESYGYVMPNHMLLQICDILPREKQGVLACCNPIPPLVRQYINEIHAIVLQAREQPLNKIEPVRETRPSQYHHPKYDVDSMLHCPHDLSHGTCTSGTVLLDDKLQPVTSLKPSLVSPNSVTMATALLSALTTATTCPQKSDVAMKVARIRQSFTSPYTLFLPGDQARRVISPSQSISTPTGLEENQLLWKLLPPTKKRKVPVYSNQTKPASTPDTKRPRMDGQKSKHIRFTESDEEDDVQIVDTSRTADDKQALPDDIEIPLRFQAPSSKKKKKKKNRNQDVDIQQSVELHLKNIRRLQEQNDRVMGGASDSDIAMVAEEGGVSGGAEEGRRSCEPMVEISSDSEDDEKFQPYDYAAGTKQFFQDSKGQQKKGYFDPQQQMRNSKGPKVGRNKTFSNRGKKSFTWKT